MYSVLGENKTEKFTISLMKRYSDPKTLTESILKAVGNSSTHHDPTRIFYFDPLKGSKVTLSKNDSETDRELPYSIEVIPLEEVEEQKNNYLYPYGEMRRSERSLKIASYQEKKPKNLPIDDLKTKKCSKCHRIINENSFSTYFNGNLMCKTCYKSVEA
jgi:hypothetical protein